VFVQVVRLIEETKMKAKKAKFAHPVKCTADDVASNGTFARFVDVIARSVRGMVEEEMVVKTVNMEASNGIEVKMPYQCYINGKFVDAIGGKT
jgi:formyltetrahydrofolate dehydrogenase